MHTDPCWLSWDRSSHERERELEKDYGENNFLFQLCTREFMSVKSPRFYEASQALCYSVAGPHGQSNTSTTPNELPVKMERF